MQQVKTQTGLQTYEKLTLLTRKRRSDFALTLWKYLPYLSLPHVLSFKFLAKGFCSPWNTGHLVMPLSCAWIHSFLRVSQGQMQGILRKTSQSSCLHRAPSPGI